MVSLAFIPNPPHSKREKDWIRLAREGRLGLQVFKTRDMIYGRGKSFANVVRGSNSFKDKSGIQVGRSCDLKIRFQQANGKLVDQLFETTNLDKDLVEGIVFHPNSTIDLTFKLRDDMFAFQQKLKDMKDDLDYVVEAYPYEPKVVTVELHQVPIRFGDDTLKTFLEREYGKVHDVECVRNKYGMKTGVRRASFDRTTIRSNPIPSFIYIAASCVRVRYEGQIETCRYCGLPGHFERNCPDALEKQAKQRREPNTTDNTTGKQIKGIMTGSHHCDPIKIWQSKRKTTSEPPSLPNRRRSDPTLQHDKQHNPQLTPQAFTPPNDRKGSICITPHQDVLANLGFVEESDKRNHSSTSEEDKTTPKKLFKGSQSGFVS